MIILLLWFFFFALWRSSKINRSIRLKKLFYENPTEYKIRCGETIPKDIKLWSYSSDGPCMGAPTIGTEQWGDVN
jgi:hypothetical protein